MKYLFFTLVGLILGAAAGIAVLYYNPLTVARTPEPASADRALHYQLPEQSLAFMHGDRALLPGTSAGDEQFWEETINRTVLLALSLNDADGAPIAAASRLIQASTETDLLLRGVLVSDHWLLTIPGEGSLFLRVDTNLWPFLTQTFIPTWYLGRPWKGPSEYRPTVGPGPKSAMIIGATGRFANAEGSAIEQYRLTTLDPASGQVALAGELHLHLLDPAIVAGEQIADSQ
jgi:hypothetical protein